MAAPCVRRSLARARRGIGSTAVAVTSPQPPALIPRAAPTRRGPLRSEAPPRVRVETAEPQRVAGVGGRANVVTRDEMEDLMLDRGASTVADGDPFSDVPALARSTRFRKSCYFDSTVAAGVKAFTTYNNMLLPSLFHDEEYETLRNDVSLWDVAAQRQVELAGPDALKLAELITPRALGDMKVGDCRYAIITDAEGVVHNDPVVLRVAEDRFWFSIADSDLILWVRGLAWALSQRSLGLNARVTEPGVSPCAVQGPKSVPLLQELFGEWVGDLKYYKFLETALDGMPILLSRSGFSPERGYELYLQDESRGNELWQRLMDAGRKYGIRPGVPNQIRRIEGGMLNYGADIKGHNALELGLPGRMVTKSAEFIGKEALGGILANGGPQRLVVGVELAPREPLDSFLVYPWKINDANGQEVGSVTSFCFSPMLSANIGLATVQIEAAKPGTKICVETSKGVCDAVIRKLPFMKRM